MSSEPILCALQQVTDRDQRGWTVTHYIVALGLERINSDGELETSSGAVLPRRSTRLHHRRIDAWPRTGYAKSVDEEQP